LKTYDSRGNKAIAMVTKLVRISPRDIGVILNKVIEEKKKTEVEHKEQQFD
jgi:hypothetical protein